jgi:hypothetical protein
MRAHNFVKPGPIILAIWFLCYLIWAIYLPYEWVNAIRKFLLNEHLELEIIRSLGLQVEFVSSFIEVSILGIFLLVALAIGFTLGVNWFKWRIARDLF